MKNPIMTRGSSMVAKGLVVGAMAVGVLILATDHCDAGRGGGRGGGGGRGHFGGGGFGGGAHVNNGFHHRPAGGGSYHRPGGGFGGGAHVDNTLPGRPGSGNRPGGGGDHRPGGGGDHRPGNGGDHDRPDGGHGGHGNDYYFGWDNPSYGYGVATGLAIGTYVYSVPANCVYQEYDGLTYRRCGDVWYQPQYEDSGIRYVVVKRPF